MTMEEADKTHAVLTGDIVMSSQYNPSDLKRLGAGGSIQLGTALTPGEYVLQIVVTDLLADPKHRVATQAMDFEIVK